MKPIMMLVCLSMFVGMVGAVPFEGKELDVPELMTAKDGTAIRTVEAWERIRRPELLETFISQEYGRRPVERPDSLRFEEAEPDAVMMEGKALRRRIRASWKGPLGGQDFTFTVFIPHSATVPNGRPAPSFVLICNRDAKQNIDPTRRQRTEFWPAEEIVARGYAAVAFWNGDIAPDRREFEFTNGVYTCWAKKRTNESWGALSAWAWGASRVLDWIETEPRLDARHVGVVGHSRGGKTALVAGVTDPRFAMACVNDSGCSGAKLNHLVLPKSESIAIITKNFPHWFCRNYYAYAGREFEMPFDQHQLVALMAPRAVAIASASEDSWAGQRGEYASAFLASPAWELYGKKGLVSDAFPKPGEARQDGWVSYHFRPGAHNLTLHDWNRYMDFADRLGWRK